MRALIQRVTQASVTVDNSVVGAIGHGWLVLLGVGQRDSESQSTELANKIINLRAFKDPAGKMNLSVRDIAGQVLVVSQFTLYGDLSRGRRPSFVDAAPPEHAEALYQHFISQIEKSGIATARGQFQATMAVQLTNDGPVTFWLESNS